jgi:hypothetical protein
VRGREAGREASDRLEALASAIAASTDAAVDTVVLFGRPATALRRHAVECGYELIVASSPVVGRGAARELATRSRVPVFGGLGARDER